MKFADLIIATIKIVVICGVVVWNVVRLTQTRHCWTRKEICENENCRWWNFCEKHGNTLFADIYWLTKIKENIEREQSEEDKDKK